MLHIKKTLLIRLISLLLSTSVALPSVAYSLPENHSDALRVPLNTPELRKRQKEVIRAVAMVSPINAHLETEEMAVGGVTYMGDDGKEVIRIFNPAPVFDFTLAKKIKDRYLENTPLSDSEGMLAASVYKVKQLLGEETESPKTIQGLIEMADKGNISALVALELKGALFSIHNLGKGGMQRDSDGDKGVVEEIIVSISRTKDEKEIRLIPLWLAVVDPKEINAQLQAFVDILNNSEAHKYARIGAGKVICEVTEPARAAFIIIDTINKEKKYSSLACVLLSRMQDLDMIKIREDDKISIAKSLISKAKELSNEGESLGEGSVRREIYQTIAVLGPSVIRIVVESIRDERALVATDILSIIIEGEPLSPEKVKRNPQAVLEYLTNADNEWDIYHILDVVSVLRGRVSTPNIAKVLIAKLKETKNEKLTSEITRVLERSLGYKKTLGIWIKGPSVGHVEPVAEAYAAIQKGDYDKAYELVMEGLLGEDYVVNIETAIGVLKALEMHYGGHQYPRKYESEDMRSISAIVTNHQNVNDQREMKDEIRRYIELHGTGRVQEEKFSLLNYKPGWTFHRWSDAKELVKKKFETTKERKQALQYILTLARVLAKNDRDYWGVTVEFVTDTATKAAKNMEEFKLLLGLAIRLAQNNIDPLITFSPIGDTPILAVTSNIANLKDGCDYLFNLNMKLKGDKRIFVLKGVIPYFVKVTGNIAKLEEAVDYLLNSGFYDKSWDPSSDYTPHLRNLSKIVRNIAELKDIIDYIVGLNETAVKFVNSVNQVVNNINDFKIVMDIVTELDRNKVNVWDFLRFLGTVPSGSKFTEDPTEVKKIYDYLYSIYTIHIYRKVYSDESETISNIYKIAISRASIEAGDSIEALKEACDHIVPEIVKTLAEQVPVEASKHMTVADVYKLIEFTRKYGGFNIIVDYIPAITHKEVMEVDWNSFDEVDLVDRPASYVFEITTPTKLSKLKINQALDTQI